MKIGKVCRGVFISSFSIRMFIFPLLGVSDVVRSYLIANLLYKFQNTIVYKQNVQQGQSDGEWSLVQIV